MSLDPRTSSQPDEYPQVAPSGSWLWCGYGGHFVGWRNCRFHLHTRVGNYRISTVGDYRPYGEPDEPKSLGWGPDSLYETMVFRVEGHGSHGEGEFTGDGELECERYATAEEACVAHTAMCWKYDAIEAAHSGRSES